jgi:hypothetical protein
MADTPQSGNDVLHRLEQLFQGLTLNQRLLLAGGAIVVGAVIWVFVVLLGQPKYVVLYSGLRSEEAQNLASRLAAKNIPHQISADGAACWCRTTSSMPAASRPLPPAYRAVRAWVLSCSIRQLGRLRFHRKSELASAPWKANWNARSPP